MAAGGWRMAGGADQMDRRREEDEDEDEDEDGEKRSLSPSMADNHGQTIKDRVLLARLDRPEALNTVLAREQSQYDCLSCRVMGAYLGRRRAAAAANTRPCRLTVQTNTSSAGASAFAGLGAYTYWSGHRQLRLREQEILRSGSGINMAARRLGITGIAAILVGLGAYRAVA
ncbi:hypothetical protein MBLNU459_g2166t2 [Dothideomycetes sp. NU459]